MLSKQMWTKTMPLHTLLKQAIMIGILYLTSEVVNDHVLLWINYSKQSFQNYYKKSPIASNIITHSQDLESQDAFRII